MDRRSEPARTTNAGIVVLMPLFNDWVSASGELCRA